MWTDRPGGFPHCSVICAQGLSTCPHVPALDAAHTLTRAGLGSPQGECKGPQGLLRACKMLYIPTALMSHTGSLTLGL